VSEPEDPNEIVSDSFAGSDDEPAGGVAEFSFMITTPHGRVCPPIGSTELAELKELFKPGMELQGNYRLVKVLGFGGMGLVFEALDIRLKRKVAVKIILPPLQGHGGPEAGNQRIDLFIQEVQTAARLSHSGIATVHYFDYHDGRPFAVYEYLPGNTLRKYLQERGKLTLLEVQTIIGPLAAALDFAHEVDVVHRDLKPENIKATAEGEFKIIDLGLASGFRYFAATTGFAGTYRYAAPEQFSGAPIDGRADQYALALITYEMLTGRALLKGLTFRAVERTYIDGHLLPDPRVPELAESMNIALRRALSREPDRRFLNCRDFAAAIGCQLTSGPVTLEILREVDIKQMRGKWRNSQLLPARALQVFLFGAWIIEMPQVWYLFATRLTLPWSPSIRLALTPDAIWFVHRNDVTRIPLTSIAEVKQKNMGCVLQLRLQNQRGKTNQSFWLPFAWECEYWVNQIRSLQSTHSHSDRMEHSGPETRTVVLLRRIPGMRLTVLRTVESKGTKRGSTLDALRLRGAILGAKALVGVQEERVPSSDHTSWCISGTAIQPRDEPGEYELAALWHKERIDKLCPSIMVYLIFDCIIRSPIVYFGEWPILLLHYSWPVLLLALVRWLHWPQLDRPASLSVLALVLSFPALLLGLISNDLLQREGFHFLGFMLSPIAWLLLPILLPIILFGFVSAKSLRTAYRENRRIEPTRRRKASLGRRVLGALAMIGSLSFFALTVGAYFMIPLASFVSQSFTNADPRESEARRYLDLGVRYHQSGSMTEAQGSYLIAKKLYEDVEAESPEKKAYKEPLGIIRGNLNLLNEASLEVQAIDVFNRGVECLDKDPDSARNSFRKAIVIFEKLANLEPSAPEFQRNLVLCHTHLGDLLVEEQPIDARRHYRTALELAESAKSNVDMRDLIRYLQRTLE
jgi:serine/threonine protein kinase/tetratricopeptide (TPR) repeat protein